MRKNILITGFQGYVGSTLIRYLNQNYPNYDLIGFDNSYFNDDNIQPQYNVDGLLMDSIQYSDIRSIDEEYLKGIDTIIHLAAISNDPISDKFEKVTYEINRNATLDLILLAKSIGVKNFIFASSCSVYGFAENGIVDETSQINPLTPYAKSKALIEDYLLDLADSDFKVTCLRFATACGNSDRLRLDLVLNDFVASALVNKKIEILSDGTPWRPLINTIDMARAMAWAVEREGNNYEIINAGSNSWNYQVKELANFVKEQLPETEIIINTNAAPDKRSYKVNFDKFAKLAPNAIPRISIQETIQHLINQLQWIDFKDIDFRKGNLIRLNKLIYLQSQKLINEELKWIN